jgi:hypothetical protein
MNSKQRKLQKQIQKREDKKAIAKSEEVVLVWLRDDMRLIDNPALFFSQGCRVVPVFVHNPIDDVGPTKTSGDNRVDSDSQSKTVRNDATLFPSQPDSGVHQQWSYDKYPPTNCSWRYPLRGAGLWYKYKSLKKFNETLSKKFGINIVI